MDVMLTDADSTVDDFESLMLKYKISIPQHTQTGADMLPIWQLLQRIREGFSGTADEIRSEFTATVAIHDLAAKVLKVSEHPNFDCLLPHLRILNSGAIHLTEKQPPYPDGYNKLIELYWACLCLSLGLSVELDDPLHPTGNNPDVIILDEQGNPARAYAFKTIRSPHAQAVFEHISYGLDQIERSQAREGIVVLHLTPRIANAGFWPTGGYYEDWQPVAKQVSEELTKSVSAIVTDNGQTVIDTLFKNRKGVGAVLCIAFYPIVAKHPMNSKATIMPLKVSTLVDLCTGTRMSDDLRMEIESANHQMQTIL